MVSGDCPYTNSAMDRRLPYFASLKAHGDQRTAHSALALARGASQDVLLSLDRFPCNLTKLTSVLIFAQMREMTSHGQIGLMRF